MRKRWAALVLLPLLLLAATASPAPARPFAPERSSARPPASGLPRAAVEADNDIPGVPLPSSPVTGTLDASTDRDDVYSIEMRAGGHVDMTLTLPPSADFGLYIFPPGSTNVDKDDFIVFSDGQTTTEVLHFTAREDGTYYIDCYATFGTGQYSLEWSYGEAPPPDDNDNIPGVPLPGPSGSLTGTVDHQIDMDDVFSITIEAKHRLRVSLRGPAQTFFTVAIFGPGATDVTVDTPLALPLGLDYPQKLLVLLPQGCQTPLLF